MAKQASKLDWVSLGTRQYATSKLEITSPKRAKFPSRNNAGLTNASKSVKCLVKVCSVALLNSQKVQSSADDMPKEPLF